MEPCAAARICGPALQSWGPALRLGYETLRCSHGPCAAARICGPALRLGYALLGLNSFYYPYFEKKKILHFLWRGAGPDILF